MQGEKPWFIKFYTDWCSHCQALAPIWESLHDNAELNVASVDCVALRGLPLCEQFGVHQMPTLLYFLVGDNKYYRYDSSDRSKENLVKFALNNGW